jgi:hypothetical protein
MNHMSNDAAGLILNRIDQWGRDRNIIGGSSAKDQFPKLIEEVGELASGVAKQNIDMIRDGIGDTIVVLTMIAGNAGLSIAECLDQAYNEIKDRKGVLLDGIFVKSTDPDYERVCAEVERRRLKDDGPTAA